MIQTISVMLGMLFKMPFLQGKRTIISAVGLIGLCLYMVSNGDYASGLTNLFFALGLLGIRFAWTPSVPITPGVPNPVEDGSLVDLFDQASMLDRLKDTQPKVAFGALNVPGKESDRRTRRKLRREAAIAQLAGAGVSKVAIAAWLPLIMALLEILPDVVDVVNKILEAIRGRKTPLQLADAEGLLRGV